MYVLCFGIIHQPCRLGRKGSIAPDNFKMLSCRLSLAKLGHRFAAYCSSCQFVKPGQDEREVADVEDVGWAETGNRIWR
jgi:hypothetical protein